MAPLPHRAIFRVYPRMDEAVSNVGSDGADSPAANVDQSRGCWSEKYGQSHRLVRVNDLPGIAMPKRVRIYRRRDHHVLQWWAPDQKRTLSERVNGDLIAAIGRARQLDERLDAFRRGGHGRRRVSHRELVELFGADLERRANAGEIRPATTSRYRTALAAYVAFTEQPDMERQYPFVERVDRNFRLLFSTFLSTPRGTGDTSRGSRGTQIVLDTARAMYEWANDPLRGAVLPEGFHNPFQHRDARRQTASANVLGEPDITVEMAVDFVAACDAYQLRLFAPVILCGLRAAEPCFIFREHVADGWLRVACLPELSYTTKGRRDKQFPLSDELSRLLLAGVEPGQGGLLYLRRHVAEGREQPTHWAGGLEQLAQEFHRRCARLGTIGARQRQQVRDQVLRNAGGIIYDDVEHEYQKLAKHLSWPAAATLKDFRHLFATSLENAGVPDSYRKFFMGHSPGTAAIGRYTHLNRVREHYVAAVESELRPVLQAVLDRSAEPQIGHASRAAS